jgi:hypothetical protein
MQIVEPLEKAKVISEKTHVPVSTLYRMERQKLLKSYRVGAKFGGVRFRLSEVLTALRREPEDQGGPKSEPNSTKG